MEKNQKSRTNLMKNCKTDSFTGLFGVQVENRHDWFDSFSHNALLFNCTLVILHMQVVHD